MCRHGDRCKVKDCPFRHISEENRLECVFYSQGFCIHGPFCRYKHLRKERADLPLVADFTLGLSQMQAAGKDGAQPRRPAPKPNEFYKIRYGFTGHRRFNISIRNISVSLFFNLNSLATVCVNTFCR